MHRYKLYFYIVLYLLAVILANLLVGHFGPASSIYIAFVFIGFDLTSRDNIHELFGHQRLKLKFMVLIGTGSGLSYLLNRDIQQIALASCVAFASAALVDTYVYQMVGHSRVNRVLVSNLFSSFVDSFVFISLAFGFLPHTILLQSISKILGGIFWLGLITYANSFILRVGREKVEPASG